jgi:Fur family ferric uptake transcriptional regulator
MQRNTRQRQLILDTLRKTCKHPTADEVYELVRVELPSISLGTIYRNLDVLNRQGEVRKVESPGGPARYDGDLRPHYHVWCTTCGAVDDVFDAHLKPLGAPRKSARGFEIGSMKVEFTGLCPACRDKGATTPC